MSELLNRVAAMSLAAVVVATPTVASGENATTRRIADGVYSFAAGAGNYSMFVVGEDRVAVFETFDSGHAGKLLEAIRSVTDKPIEFAFISHNHWDHASGAKVFSDAGAQTVMHQRAARPS